MAQLSLTCPTTTTSGFVTTSGHEDIDSLVHMLSEDSFGDIVRNAQNQVTNFNVLTSVAGTDVRTTEVIRNDQNQAIQVIEKQYDAGGVLVQTLTTDVTRSGGQVVSITTDEVQLF